MSEAAAPTTGGVTRVHAARLFTASCVALTSGAAMFAVTGDIMGALKQTFIMDNEQVGWVVSGGSWGFMLAMLGLGPLCDALGMRLLLRLALVFHAAGILMMIFANGFWLLFCGALLNAVGSGAVEAACNPLTATIYPASKTEKLNQFHMWFPGGIVLGGLACYGLSRAGLGIWQLKLAILLVPTAAYGILFTGQVFPATERVQSGVSFGGMFRETFLRPLFLVLLFCMMLTSSLELGPQRWIPSVLEAGGIPGILVLVWITGLMAVLRLVAGPVVRILTNTGVLLLSAIVGGLGLVAMSYSSHASSVVAGLGLPMSAYATHILVVGGAATIFAVGVCYFWPTMVGTVAERVPKGGALALGVLGGVGSLIVGVVTTPLMGWVADQYLHKELVARKTVDSRVVDRQAETIAVLRGVGSSYDRWQQSLGDSPREAITRSEIREVLDAVGGVLAEPEDTRPLPPIGTANALRVAIKNGPADDPKETRSDAEAAALAAKARAAGILNPADNKGGLISFRYVAPMSIVLVVAFGVMLIQDRRRARAQA